MDNQPKIDYQSLLDRVNSLLGKKKPSKIERILLTKKNSVPHKVSISDYVSVIEEAIEEFIEEEF